jgi:hypothetical protein
MHVAISAVDIAVSHSHILRSDPGPIGEQAAGDDTIAPVIAMVLRPASRRRSPAQRELMLPLYQSEGIAAFASRRSPGMRSSNRVNHLSIAKHSDIRK